MNIAEIEDYLSKSTQRQDLHNVKCMQRFLLEEKERCKIKGQEDSANRIRCLEFALGIQKNYFSVFYKLKNKKFYKAWCLLERCEIDILFLEKHVNMVNDEFCISTIKDYVRQFQSLFPYKIFMSAELVEEEVRCSICNKIITPRNFCGHSKGNLYNGDFCYYIVSKSQFLGASVVRNPAQKCCVPFSSDEKTGKSYDHYTYTTLEYLMQHLKHPFSEWKTVWGKKELPPDNYAAIRRGDLCPCGSEKIYAKCCIHRKRIMQRHCTLLIEGLEKQDEIDFFL